MASTREGFGPSGLVTVSVVSHGHGPQVQAMLRDLAAHCARNVSRLVLTLNQAEPALKHFVAETAWPFEIRVLENPTPQSFGFNHNRAFASADTPLFCVLNPDLRLPVDPFPALQAALAGDHVALAYPVQRDDRGERQDFERSVPTPLSLFRRVFLGRKQSDGMDWVNGAFMLFRTEAYRRLGGFDARYRLYCEDVDICIRLQLDGYRMQLAPVDVVHLAQRATGRRLRHFVWHVQSMLHLWCSAAFWRFLLRRTTA